MIRHRPSLLFAVALSTLVGCEPSPGPSGAASAQPASSALAAVPPSAAPSAASSAASSAVASELTVNKPKEVAETADSDLGTLPEGVGLAVGTDAPDFELPGIDGKKVRLHALLDESKVLLVFYRGGW